MPDRGQPPDDYEHTDADEPRAAPVSRETKSANWNTAAASAIFAEPLPPMKWAVAGLGIAPGRPCGLWGKATGGKTLEAIDIAISKASGTPVFGRFEVERGRVLWVSYDLPSRPLHTRFRQLANGRGLGFAELDGMIETCVFPEVYLNSDGAEVEFSRRAAGFDLVIIDCYRDGVPGTEENSSEQAIYLKSLARISEGQGTSFLYLHHLKKGDDSNETTIDSGRGSGAIAAASGSIWALEGTGKKPRLMRNIRPHDAATDFAPRFYVELEIGTGGLLPCDMPPIRLVARTEAEMAGEAFMAQVESNKRAGRDRLACLLDLLRTHPNCTMRDLRGHVRGTVLARKDTLHDTLDDAVESGLVLLSDRQGKGGRAHVYNVSPPDADAAQ